MTLGMHCVVCAACAFSKGPWHVNVILLADGGRWKAVKEILLT